MQERSAGSLVSLVFASSLIAACSSPSGEAPVIRLQDEFADAVVTGAVAAEDTEPTILRFSDAVPPPTAGLIGVENLRIENGNLTGATTAAFPIVRITRTEGLANPDLLYSVEIRARVSAGENLGVYFDSADEQNAQGISIAGGVIPWSLSTPLISGGDFQTYELVLGTGFNTHVTEAELNGYGMRQILLRPSDAAGAQFEIESIRLVYRREYMATVPSGVSWQGFEHRSKETIVTRAPERVSFDVELPSRPWLDLSVGTSEQLPVTFRVTAEQGGRVVLEREKTLTTTGRWETMQVDLAGLANQSISLSLELESEQPGALGFWGAPAIRNSGAVSQAAPDAPQGVILFVADTLRSDHTTPYGYARDTTPTLARLAAEGAVFLDNQANSTWTKVSVPSFHSSTYPRSNGVQQMLDRLPAAATTIAEAYRAAGYATLGSSGNTFVGSGTNLHQGFEDFEEAAALNDILGDTPSKTARAQVDRVLPWLEAHADVPFFINIQVTDPHSPFLPQAPYDTYYGSVDTRQRYDAAIEKLLTVRPNFTGVGAPAQGEPTRAGITEAGIDPADILDQHHAWYDGSIRAMDTEFGRIVETLESLGLRDKVMIVFIADHGEEFLEHGGHFHRQVYGENSNVPLVFWAPGRIVPGTRIAQTTQSIDLLPTMLELSGLPIPDTAQGQSLVPLLEPIELAAGNVAYAQGAWRQVPVFSERMRESDGGIPGDKRMFAYSVIDGGYKLVHNIFVSAGLDIPEYQLFDHAADPLDQVDLALGNPDEVARLTQLLEDWLGYADASQLPDNDAATEGLSEAELRRLCSLGYIPC